MLGLGYQVLVEDVKFLTAGKLMDLVCTTVVITTLSGLRALRNACCDFPVGEGTRVVLVQPVRALVLFKYAIV